MSRHYNFRPNWKHTHNENLESDCEMATGGAVSRREVNLESNRHDDELFAA